MKSNTGRKSSFTLPAAEHAQVLRLRRLLKASSNTEVIRRSLKLLEESVSREELRRQFREASAASDHPPSKRCRTWIGWRATASKMPDRSPRRGELWAADLNPRRGSEPGKIRLVVIVQSDLLNETDHPSTWVFPCTTRLSGENVLRVELPIRMAGNARVCEVMIDQSRAIDRRRLVRPIGRLPQTVMKEVAEKLRRVGDL